MLFLTNEMQEQNEYTNAPCGHLTCVVLLQTILEKEDGNNLRYK